MAFVHLSPSARPKHTMRVLPEKLGIVAGGGTLPEKLITYCKSKGTDVFVIGIEGHVVPETLAHSDHAVMRIGTAGQMIKTFQEKGYKNLVIIGSVRRPKLSEMRPDLKTIGFFAKLGLKALGDDGLLKAVRADLERDGFVLHGIQDFLPDITMPRGVLTKNVPNEEQYELIRMGLQESQLIGEADIGQSVVVKPDGDIEIEDAQGTNALIRRAAKSGAILVKSVKPQQDRTLDMPTLGPESVTLCADMGYAGIAAEYDGVLLTDRDAMIEIANARGLFLVGV